MKRAGILLVTVLLLSGCETVSKEEQARRANQRQTDYVAEIDRRKKEAEEQEKGETAPSWWDRWMWGDWTGAPNKEPPRELTEAELKPRR